MDKHDRKPGRKPRSDDLQLFREAVADARPLRAQARVDNRPVPPAPRPRQREADERAVLDELLQDPGPEEGLETGEELLFLRDGYQKRYLHRLRRGSYAVGRHLDLHGMNEAAASAALLAFVDEAVANGQGCVRVVHGKGLRSRSRPKLKLMTARLLRRHRAVIAYASCRPADGGTGAVTVLLKTRR